jgi:hypothetical protein
MTTPFAAAGLAFRLAMMMTQAQMVIVLRLWGMAGLWNVAGSENLRMVTENAAAAAEASAAGVRAVARGAAPVAVAEAMLKPVSRRTRANARRLTRRGPRKP